MKLGFIGLGKMGSQMATRLIGDSHEVLVFDVNTAAIDKAVAGGAKKVQSREDLVQNLAEKPVVWLMIPSQFVDDEITALLELLPQGAVIVDGGNSDYRLTLKRAAKCKDAGVSLVDVGTSGGVLGLKDGFSMMVGGDQEAYEVIKPLLESLAQTDGYNYFGSSGAGHFVKMVHNAIEYGVMQSYAEGFNFIKNGSDFGDIDLAALAKVWQHGSIIKSDLNALIQKILEQDSALDGVEGFVAESGEARWAIEAAKAKGEEIPSTEAAMKVRLDSQNGKINFGTKLLAAMRNAFGGHDINKS